MLPFVLCLLAGTALSGASEPPEPLVLIGAPQRTLAMTLDDRVQEDLRLGRWEAAANGLERVDLTAVEAAERGDRAFVLAWSLVHAGRAEDAEPLLDALMERRNAPEPYVDLVRAEILLAVDRDLEALDALERVPDSLAIYARAAVVRAEVLRELGRSAEAFAIYEDLVKRPDPAAGNAVALLALARRAGAGSESAYPHLRRIWSWYPGSDEEREAVSMLGAYSGAEWRPTWQEAAVRAERLMWRGRYDSAIQVASSRLAEATDDSVDACRLRYVLGRSAYKKNRLSDAVSGFGDAGTRCTEAEGEYGAKSLYLQGTAEFRRGRYEASAAAYRILADQYTDHSMADDGLTRGGISLQEAGKLAEAQKWWLEALDRFPEGDTVPEASWRLAFSYYLDGEPEQAIAIAERLAALPLDSDAVHVEAGRYWAARWRVYPDVENPTQPVSDPAAVQQAIAGWEALVRELPWSFYSIQAHSRLRELAPELAAELEIRSADHTTGDRAKPWRARLDVVENPAMISAVALMRLGLVRDARAELDAAELPELSPEEMAWWTELRIAAGDWLLAHDTLRRYLWSHALGGLGERQPQIVRVAWPDRYWELVQTASAGDRYDDRLFHALVREESNFNRSITSFAGARGLSQLMPATARQTAGWLGMKVNDAALNDPKTNLTIGARYLDAMHKEHGNSPYLALAAYNAGGGRVRQWLGEWGNVPTDEYVERIPFRETRGYVRRVMGTWQTMRWQFDIGESGFYDLSAFNHEAKPD